MKSAGCGEQEHRQKETYGDGRGRDMAWIIGAAAVVLAFLAGIYILAGIALGIAGSFQTD